MQFAAVQGFAFALFSALICAYLIHTNQRIFRGIAVCSCLVAGALLATDQRAAALAALLIAAGIMFIAAGLAVHWECMARWRDLSDQSDD